MPIILIRHHFVYRHIPIERVDKSPLAEAARREDELIRLTDFITKQCAVGVHITRKALEGYAAQLGMSRDDLRDRCVTALKLGNLVELPLPAGERRTRRTKYLAPYTAEANRANRAESRGTVPRDSNHPDEPAARQSGGGGTSIGRAIQNRQKGGHEDGTEKGNRAESRGGKRPRKSASMGRQLTVSSRRVHAPKPALRVGSSAALLKSELRPLRRMQVVSIANVLLHQLLTFTLRGVMSCKVQFWYSDARCELSPRCAANG